MEIELTLETVDSADTDKLTELYEYLKDKKTFHTFMYGGNTLDNFKNFCRNSWIYLCVLENRIVGITVFNSFSGKTAMIHFCMVDAFEHTADFGRLILHNVFASGYFTTILGATPKVYRHAFSKIYAIGFEFVDIIEEYTQIKGKYRSVVFTKLTKDIFYKKNKEFIYGVQ